MDNLHGCLPYWSHCHSISATGRQYPEFFIFKGLMIPTATLMVLYWIAMFNWMLGVGLTRLSKLTIVTLGLIASVALTIYTLTLGAIGEPYALARRIGVILFFAFTAFAHLLLAAKLINRAGGETPTNVYSRKLLTICNLLIIIGVLSSLLGFFWSGYDNWDNAFEWWFALLMMVQFVYVGRLWSESDYQLTFTVKH